MNKKYKFLLVGFVCFFSFFQTGQAGFFDWFKFKRSDSQNASQKTPSVALTAKQYTFSVSKSGSGVVTSDDGKINCGKQCKASYSAKSKIVLKAEAGENYKFEKWNGCDKISDGQCQTTLNKSKLVVAKFAFKNPSLSRKNPSPSIIKTSSSKSSAISFQSSSSKSYLSSKSSGSVSNKKTQNLKTLTIKNIFYNKGKGIVKIGNKICDVSQCVFEYDLNTSLELRAESESGSVLSDWGYDCDYVFAPNNICNLIMNSNKTVIVHFEPRVSVASSLKSSSSISSSKSSSLSSSGDASSSSSLFTNNQYYLRITSPNEGETWKKGSTQSIKFITNKFDRFITLKLYKNNNYLLDIGYYDIAYSNPSKNPENIYSWNVPSSLNDGEDYKIHAVVTNSKELYGYEISDRSDNVFAVKTSDSSSISGLSFSSADTSDSFSSPSPSSSVEAVSMFTAPTNTITYSSFYAGSLDLYPWYGRNIVLLTPTAADLDSAVIFKIIKTYDEAYDYYKKITGAEPAKFNNTTINDRATIAIVPKTCGAGCGYLGFTGIEMPTGQLDNLYGEVLNKNKYPQIIFYELGRNFWFYSDKISYKESGSASIATGFAIYMRFLSMDYAKIQGSDFRDKSFEEFRSEVEKLTDAYENDTSLNWENTLKINKAPSNAMGLGGADLVASFLFRLRRDHGGEKFVENIWKEIGKRSNAITTQDAIDNFILASSAASDSNLTNLFVGKWRWPMSENAKKEAVKYQQ